MISIRTNVDSVNAQQNLKLNSSFQSKTIQQLTSGYRINSSGDDAAGLAIANSFRSNITELNQGVANGNDGVSQLQIIDGGLNNISTILDRMKTLATQSASGSFTGSRATLNQEYNQLTKEITRQASNVNLNAGGSMNTVMNVYIGGASNSNNAGVSVDLSGSAAVDATSLKLDTTNVLGGGVSLSGNTQRIDANSAMFVKGTAGTNDQSFTFQLFANGNAQTVTAKVAASTNGSSLSDVLSTLNGQLNQYGVTAQTDANGQLQFSGATAFTVSAASAGGTGTSQIITGAGTASNTANYSVAGQATFAAVATTGENLSFQTSGGSVSVALASTDTVDSALAKINSKTSAFGVYAVKNAAGTGISFQGGNTFSVSTDAGTSAGSFAASTAPQSATAPVTSTATNAQAAISAINDAVKALGLVQGRVGAGENKLQYAISLAQSQISSFSAAESQIRDADVAAQAANLTKSQVLQQTSIAAMAQANQEPQAIMKLLQ